MLSHYLLFLYSVQLYSTFKPLFHHIWSKYYEKTKYKSLSDGSKGQWGINSDLSLVKCGFYFLLYTFVFCDLIVFVHFFNSKRKRLER